MALIDEIREQPEISRRLLAGLPPRVEALAAAARAAGIGYAMIAARGSSDHAAIYGQYVLGALAGLPVVPAKPSLFTRYGTPPRVGSGLVVGVSQSGHSPDVVAVVSQARAQGAVTAAVTNDPASPLAVAAEHLLPLDAGEERSVAATKTYTAELLVLAMLATALGDGSAAHAAALAEVPRAQADALGAADAAEALAGEWHPTADCVVLGRGFNLASAAEWALKLKELAYVRAHAYSTADFQHGPVASLDPGGRVLAFAAGGPLADDTRELLVRLRDERGARLLVVAADALDGAAHLGYPDRLPEWLSPLVAIVPAQLFTRALALAKGLDVERPRGLRKVTLTR